MKEQSDPPDLALIAQIAPEQFWEALENLMPKACRDCDTMLLSGMTPEWIVSHSPAEMPAEVGAGFLNAIKYRRDQLYKAALLGAPNN